MKIGSEDEVRELILSMVCVSLFCSPFTSLIWYSSKIESNDINAQISADGTVTFSDLVPQVSKAQVDKALEDVQAQATALSELEREMGKSKEFLAKVCRVMCSALS